MPTQKLIVEGNDAILLAELCKRSGLSAPKGYENSNKFKKEFVKVGNGYEGAKAAFREAVEKGDDERLGIVVDANDAGAVNRWQELRGILAMQFSEETLAAFDQQPQSKIIQEPNKPTVGVWIMPNNVGNGYFEHFVAELVPTGDPLFAHAQNVLADLQNQPFNELTANRIGKAKLHTWLAWKRDPGKPFGQAMQAGYFDQNAPMAQQFLNWFTQVFDC